MCVSWLNCVLFIKLLSKDAQVLLQKLGVEEVSEAILLTCRNTICLYFAWYSVRKTEISLYRSFQTLDLVFLQDEAYNKGISCTEKWLDLNIVIQIFSQMDDVAYCDWYNDWYRVIIMLVVVSCASITCITYGCYNCVCEKEQLLLWWVHFKNYVAKLGQKK